MSNVAGIHVHAAHIIYLHIARVVGFMGAVMSRYMRAGYTLCANLCQYGTQHIIYAKYVHVKAISDVYLRHTEGSVS